MFFDGLLFVFDASIHETFYNYVSKHRGLKIFEVVNLVRLSGRKE